MSYKSGYLNSRSVADSILMEVRDPTSTRKKSGIGSRSKTSIGGLQQTVEDAKLDPSIVSTGYLAQVRDTFGSERVQELVGEYQDENGDWVSHTIQEGPDFDISAPQPGSQRPPARIEGEVFTGEADDVTTNLGYPEGLTQRQIENIIQAEAVARNMDPTVAIQIFRHEGAGGYQSGIARTGSGSAGGREASYGPYQLFTGGGLGNEYEELTGRTLASDNTVEGIITQVRFALDKAAENGWGAWYGRGPAGIGVRQGLDGATPIYNWRNE